MTTTRMSRLVHTRTRQHKFLLEASSLTAPLLVASTLVSTRVLSIRLPVKFWLREVASELPTPLPEELGNTLVLLDPKSSSMAERVTLRRILKSAIPAPIKRLATANRQPLVLLFTRRMVTIDKKPAKGPEVITNYVINFILY
jgi:hypothetical protein